MTGARNATGDEAGIINQLKDAMKRKGDFPAISPAVISLLKTQTTGGGIPDLNAMAGTIIGDFGLTKKILTMVNSVFYAGNQLEGKVDSISRAILILGYEKIKSIVVSFSVLETLSGMNLPIDVKDTILSSFLSGFITKGIVDKIKYENAETAFISAIFHNLGKLLVSFYLPSVHKRVVEAGRTTVRDEDSVSTSIFGISYCELGIAIAHEWNIADDIIRCMYKLSGNDLLNPLTEEYRMQAIVNFSNELCFIVKDIEKKPRLLNLLLVKYSEMFTIPDNVVMEIVAKSLKEMESYASVLKVNIEDIPFLSGVRRVIISAQAGLFYESDVVKPVVEMPVIEDSAALSQASVPMPQDGGKAEGVSVGRDARQPAGDVNIKTPYDGYSGDTPEFSSSGIFLLQSYEPVPLQKRLIRSIPDKEKVKAILKELYARHKFTRVVLFTRNVFGTFMEARFGIGKDAEKALEHFRFRLAKDGGIFDVGIRKNSSLAIKDVTAANVRKYIPGWLTNHVSVRSLIVIPVVIDGEPPALIYADREETQVPDDGSNGTGIPPAGFGREMVASLNDFRQKAVEAFSLPDYGSIPSGNAVPVNATPVNAATVGGMLVKTTPSNATPDKVRDGSKEQTVYWCRKLRESIKNDRFVPFFQSIVNNSTGSVEMFECLARIVEDEQRVIPPGKFIKHARLYGMMPLVTMEIIKRSYNAARAYPYGLTINITDGDVENDMLRSFLDFFAGQIKFPYKKVIIEVQPDGKQFDLRQLEKCLKFLKKTGFKTAIDNVGASHIDFIKLLEQYAHLIDFIKIDGFLVKNMANDEKYYNAVKHIAKIAWSNNIKSIAMFVDDKACQDMVQKLGIDYSQGYYFDIPRRDFSSSEGSLAKVSHA
ncbi:MAG: EAL domain-containing protein [Nitrospirae bacterium]|nr:EAL domain-containing protein [Nitrospirota bacterium]